MDSSIIPVLFMITLLAVLIFAMVSKARTEESKRDPNAPISTLAKDGKYGGVRFLLPLAEQARRAGRWQRGQVLPAYGDAAAVRHDAFAQGVASRAVRLHEEV